MPSWLVPLETLAQRRGGDDPRAIGGKAARLVWLVRHGFDVPRAVVLPAQAFTLAIRGLHPPCEPRSLLRGAAGRDAYVRAAEARQQILVAPLPDGLEAELSAVWAELGESSPWGLAVRSSATCEDGALVSMAGLAESVLGARAAAGPRHRDSAGVGVESRAGALSPTSRRTECATSGWAWSCKGWSRRAPAA
jgi:rifampicin phosphotransferase